MEPQPGEIHREACFRTGDAKIRHHREADAGAHCRAMHRRDDRLAGAPQPLRLLIEVTSTLCSGPYAIGAAATEVGAGAEMLALGA